MSRKWYFDLPHSCLPMVTVKGVEDPLSMPLTLTSSTHRLPTSEFLVRAVLLTSNRKRSVVYAMMTSVHAESMEPVFPTLTVITTKPELMRIAVSHESPWKCTAPALRHRPGWFPLHLARYPYGYDFTVPDMLPLGPCSTRRLVPSL